MDLKLFVVVVAASLAVASSQRIVRPDCPRYVHCLVNPCDGLSCPRYTDAECRPDYCNGECRADFFRGTTNVTSRCGNARPASSCTEKTCSDERVCVEEEVPCPRDRPRERCPDPPRMKVKCMVMEQPQPVTDCSAVRCQAPSECVVRDTSEGPRAECEPRRPRDCTELTCDRGMRCEERERNGTTEPRCVADRTQPRPNNCSEVMCREGMVCMRLRNRTRCVDRPPPRTCAELRCQSGYECQERGQGDDRRAQCVELPRAPPTEAARSCAELECPKGYQCTLRADGRTRLVPSCVPRRCPVPRRPSSCLELDCGDDQRCTVDRDGLEDIPRCRECIAW